MIEFVNTAIRRKPVEVSHSRLTEKVAIEMDETKSRYLPEWIQEGATRTVREDQEVPDSRLM